jgi:hypothetical protein
MLALGMLLLVVIMRLLALLGLGDSFHNLSFLPLAFIFMIAGAAIYGSAPKLLHKQLVVFLAFCVPIMIGQILGISPWLMVWDTSFLEGGLSYKSGFTIDDVGKFKDLALYPTLFVNADDVNFVLGQARPSGLTHNNNVVSLFISLAIALNIAIDRSLRLTLSDIFISLAAVLSMSKLVFGMAILIYVGYLFFGSRQKKFISFKLIILFIFTLALYFFMFPGLLLINFSGGTIMTSVIVRLGDIISALGLSDIFQSITALEEFDFSTKVSSGYTTWAKVLRNPYAIPMIAIIVAVLGRYYLQVSRIHPRDAIVYKITLLACVLSQFGVPFYSSQAFHLIVGVGLFPIFTKLWPKDICNTADSVGKIHT